MSSSRHHLLASPAPSAGVGLPSGGASPPSPVINSGFNCLCINPSSLPETVPTDAGRISTLKEGLTISKDLASSERIPSLHLSDLVLEPSAAVRRELPSTSRSASNSRTSQSGSFSQLDVSVPTLERFHPDLGRPSYELLEPWEEIRLSNREMHASQDSAPPEKDGVGLNSATGAFEASFDQDRRVYINNPLRTSDSNSDIVGNKVRTSKYTIFNFFPKNLFEQFRRIAYIYFLAIVGLNQIPQLAVFGRTASLFPLLFVLVATAIKDGYEDWGRHRSDVVENNRVAQVFFQGQFRPKKWKRIEVGEVIKVYTNCPVPCDMVLLETSDPTGAAYIQTLNLDGESTLKTRYAKQETQVKQPDINAISGVVVCEPPTRNIYEFAAYMELDNAKIPLGPSNVILRGCELKNTAWIVGVVVYAGNDTKVMMNSAGAQSKRSKLESQMNRATMWLAILLLVICFVGGLGMGLWVSRHQNILNTLAYYHKIDTYAGDNVSFYNAGGEALITFLSFVIMFQVMIPISLYISMELVRLGQSTFMSRDLEMYHSGSDTRFECRALNINEDLGQIKYVFCDKTGTLTENKMEFHTASIDGIDYSDGVAYDSCAGLSQNLEWKGDCWLRPKQIVNVDLKLLQLTQNSQQTLKKKAVQEFFVVLAVCNTVVPIKVNEEKHVDVEAFTGNSSAGVCQFIEYQSESPDEQALVSAAASYGYVLFERTSKHVNVEVQGELQRFELLGLHEFDSVRKRMSVVVRCPDKSIKVMLKGADTTVLDLVAKPTASVSKPESEEHLANVLSCTQAHLDQYAREGLRTLVVASKDLSEAEFQEWSHAYASANTALANRVVLLRGVAEIIERDLTLLGATGVEDKLQDGVPETIAALRAAGMKVWMLTGDKQETGISIGFSCSLLTHDMKQIIISSATPRGCRDAMVKAKETIRSLEERKITFSLQNHIDNKQSESVQSSPRSSSFFSNTGSLAGTEPSPKASRPLALIIDGQSLVHALEKDLEQELFDLATACQVVICCRVAPSQKANIVALIKEKTEEMTLAIGDGANDVPMIQKAHVGVGISGQEGRQAVMSSDFSMGQFRFLRKLLLVHGHWNYRRLSYMVLYNFYRNSVFVMMLFWYILHTAFSPSSAIFDWNLMFYSLIYTSVPTIVVGIWDKDIGHKTLLCYPPLYGAGQRSENYNSLLFWMTMLDTLWQSLALFYVPFCTYQNSTIDIWSIGSLWTISVVILVNLHLAMDVQRWTWITHLAIWGSIASTFCCLFILDAVKQDAFLSHYGVIYKIIQSCNYWFDILLIVILALLPRLCVKVVVQNFWPSDLQIVREAEIRRKAEVRKKRKGSGKGSEAVQCSPETITVVR